MKTRLALLALALATPGLAADTVPADTAVFLQADAKATVIGRLKKGESVTYVGEAPDGWRRVEVTGEFTGFALGRDLNKALDVRVGSNIYATPEKDAPVLTVVQKGDKTELTGFAGANRQFGQVTIKKTLQGFIATGPAANVAGAGAAALVTSNPPPAAPANPTGLGHPVAITGDPANLPRQFAGTLVLARRPIFNPNPPYDFQLTDSNGRRFAYVDTRRLVTTDKIDSFVGLSVTLTGTVRNTVDGKDLVVDAESIRRN